MKSSIVTELQAEALKQDIPIASLLRKAHVVSRKLKISEFDKWTQNELNGYTDVTDLPPYRELPGQIQYFNQYNGRYWPIMIADNKLDELFSNRKYFRPAPEIEDALLKMQAGEIFCMELPNDIQVRMMRSMQLPSAPVFVVQRPVLANVIESVRNIILDWALRLDEDGIRGDGISFSDKEIKAANEASYYVNNFYAPVHGSQIQQDTQNSSQNIVMSSQSISELSHILADIDKVKSELALETASLEELNSEIITLRTQINSPRPKIPIIRESLSSIRNILEGTAGSLIASGLIYKVGEFIKAYLHF